MGLDHGLRQAEEDIIDWHSQHQIQHWFSNLPAYEDNGVTKVTGLELKQFYTDCAITVAAKYSNYTPMHNPYDNTIWHDEGLLATLTALNQLTILDGDEFTYWEVY